MLGTQRFHLQTLSMSGTNLFHHRHVQHTCIWTLTISQPFSSAYTDRLSTVPSMAGLMDTAYMYQSELDRLVRVEQ